MPLAAEAVEVVHEKAAHESLDGLVDVADRHALLEYLIFVHVHKLLRNAGKKRGAQAGYLRAFPRRGNECVKVCRQELHILAGAILQNERESAGSADSGNGGWRKVECDSFWKLAEFLVNALLHHLKLLGPGLAVLPFV